MTPPELGSQLILDIGRLLEGSDDYDVRLEVGTGPDVETFRAHSVILRARSPYFRSGLSSRWARYDEKCITFRKPNVSAQVFSKILKYIYTGSVDIKETDTNLLDLMVAADELELYSLVNYVQDYIINEAQWVQRNIIKTLQMSNRLACKKLRHYCDDVVYQDPELIFRSPDFTALDEDELISLLKRDDLGMDEVQVWEHVISWGLAQNSALSVPLNDWSSEHFSMLEEVLCRTLPHIRFFNIARPDYYFKVMPYEKILPDALHADLKRYHYVDGSDVQRQKLPPRIQANKPDSLIINVNHVVLLSRWISGQSDNPFTEKRFVCRKVPYKFKLLLRTSRDGTDPETFHVLCDHQGPTVVLIKIVGSGDIIGGYNPVQWSSSGEWISTSESFLFNLGDGENLHDVVLSRVKYAPGAICDFKGMKATGFGSGDLRIFNNTCNPTSYHTSILNGAQSFRPVELEVFAVQKKPRLFSPQTYESNAEATNMDSSTR